MAYPRYQLARQHKHSSRTTGDVTFTSTSFVDIANGLDMTLSAQVGDVIEYATIATVSAAGASDLLILDVATIVSSAPVNYLSGGTVDGLLRHQDSVAAQLRPANFSIQYTLVAGDLSSGYVTLRLRGKGNNTNNKIVYADGTNRRLYVSAKNLGPVDPN